MRTGDLRKAVQRFVANNALDLLVLSPPTSGLTRLIGGAPTAGDAEAPILILPAAVWIRKERITARAVAGAVLAVAGTAVLFS